MDVFWESRYLMYLTGIGGDNAFVRVRRFYLQSHTHVDKRVRKFDTLKRKKRGFGQINVCVCVCMCVCVSRETQMTFR